MNYLRVALVGCGIISEDHIRGYRQHADRARIVVCCDIDRSRAEQRAALVGPDTRAQTSYEAVLADPAVDAVELCTPHHLHRDAVVAAARAGKQILCQKPLAKTLEDCDVMIAAANAAGVTLFYAEMNRTLPAAVLARTTIDAGRIGTPIGVQATAAHWQGGDYLTTSWRYDPAVSGGGQLLDGGIHAVDLMMHLGGPIRSVSCFTTRFRPELGGEDTSVLNTRFAGGGLGALFSSQAAGMWLPGPHFTAFGTEGALALGGPGGALVLHRPDLPDRHEVLLERNGDPFAAMIGRYLDVVLDGAPNPAPASLGKETLRVILAAYESVRLGREVLVED
jgi:predicted dehydrogenase